MKTFFSLLIQFIFTTTSFAQKQVSALQLEKGKTLAKRCWDCHADTANALAGPLRGIREIRTAHYIYSLLKNPMQFAEKNKTAKKAFAKRGLQMPPFPDLTRAEIKAILDYFDSIPKSKKD